MNSNTERETQLLSGSSSVSILTLNKGPRVSTFRTICAGYVV